MFAFIVSQGSRSGNPGLEDTTPWGLVSRKGAKKGKAEGAKRCPRYNSASAGQIKYNPPEWERAIAVARASGRFPEPGTQRHGGVGSSFSHRPGRRTLEKVSSQVS